MTPEAFLAAAEQRLAEAKYAVERVALPGAPAVVGRRKTFRVQWFLTQLKTTVVVAAVETVTVAGWVRFGQDAFELAKAFKGGLPNGLQSGIGAIPILAGRHVEPEAAALAKSHMKSEWFTGVSLPAIVDLTTGQVHGSPGGVVGAIYVPFLRKQRSLVTNLVRQEH